jgi:hypothetical protein
MQVEPKQLKAPGTQRLNLKYDKLLSSLAFEFNLRRYNEDATLKPQFESGGGNGEEEEEEWVDVPEMRITAVHGLDDGHPAMAVALRQLTALTENA